MRALIMAGGAGSRLNLGEKPLILINNRPMLGYVTDAFLLAGCNVVVATLARIPMTRNGAGQTALNRTIAEVQTISGI